MKMIRFDRLFASLVGAFKRYHDTPRSPDGVARLALARQQLDDARGAMADERDRIGAHLGPKPGPIRKFDVSEENLVALRIARLKDSNRAS